MKGILKRLVVMGGSFNPPTVAHYRLMKAAVDALGAEHGLFVPVSDAYLRRKMRHSHPPVVLSPELRVKMLRVMCDEDARLDVCDIEIGTVEPRTFPTLLALRDEYPDHEIYFLMGADKLGLLANMAERRDFFDSFRAILYSRGEEAFEQELMSNELLALNRDRIVILPQPEGTDGVSSSAVRDRMLAGESCEGLLMPGVWELFSHFTAADFPDVVNRFKGEYDFLGNRYPCGFVWQGVSYGSVDAAFRALSARCRSQDEMLEFMESLVQAKFYGNPGLMRRLLDTGNRTLINGNQKKELFWGVDLYSWLGENRLGKIIMEIRDKNR